MTVPVFALIPVAIVFLALAWWYPDLLSTNHGTTFSTIGTLVTLYAAVIAIAEIIRARSMAERIFEETRKVAGILGSFHDIQEIVECQNLIGTAIVALEDGLPIPPTALIGIIKIYSKLFRERIADDGSYGECRAFLYAYKSSSKGKQLRENTLTILRTILGQISEHAGSRSTTMQAQLVGDGQS